MGSVDHVRDIGCKSIMCLVGQAVVLWGLHGVLYGLHGFMVSGRIHNPQSRIGFYRV